MEPQICPVVCYHPRAEGAFYGIPDNTIVGILLDVGGHVDLVVPLDVVPKLDEIIIVGRADGTVVSTRSIGPYFI